MQPDLNILLFSALSIGCMHTLLGPDHYLPFIMLAKAEKWSISKTISVVIACGLGHVFSSIALGVLGIGLGIALTKLTGIEALRANLAGWAVIAFGLAYSAWAFVQVSRKKPHVHVHVHAGGQLHSHAHNHTHDHVHVHQSGSGRVLTPWVLFIIFAFGPCEPLIPLLIYPAAAYGVMGTILIAALFSVVTIITMLALVLAGYYGLNELKGSWLEEYSPLLAGITILASGLGIQFLGL
ncbi:MAG: CorA family divalent cation transporter [Anaerolineae bacterium]|nr:CorA family divalent cation transporter [Anaerolineae bacterium]